MAINLPGEIVAQVQNKKLLTLGEVNEQYEEDEHFVMSVKAKGQVHQLAFRAPTLNEVRRAGAGKSDELSNTLDFLSMCCLTHDRPQLEEIGNRRAGFMKVAAEGITALMSQGVEVVKKG